MIVLRIKPFVLTLATLAMLSACSGEKQKESITEGGMKCGPGKCGASMVDGSAVLVKKKMNILKQLQENDNRRECVLQAKTSKTLYDCVRVEKTGRLSKKCSTDNTKKIDKKSTMKCEAGKCGNSM
ncbi:MAG: hypothetical protein DRQ78_02085 [Epsilonproteobacteria bacterium]|nr:MAG: hypothetical protein DRQ78_02085 [Campylobacterota bacterium]